MGFSDRLEMKVGSIPRQRASELSGAERVGIALVTLFGLTGLVGTTVIAWAILVS